MYKDEISVQPHWPTAKIWPIYIGTITTLFTISKKEKAHNGHIIVLVSHIHNAWNNKEHKPKKHIHN